LDEQALVGLAGGDGRTGVAASEKGFSGIDPQPTLLLLWPVATKAVLDQERANRLFEVILGPAGAGGSMSKDQGRKNEQLDAGRHSNCLLIESITDGTSRKPCIH
jgi:hypothetical protein